MHIPGGLLFIWGAILIVASQKTPIMALQKWKTRFTWNKTKNDLYDVPRHPKGHMRVRYGLVPTNYAMIRTVPSSLDLEVMQPRTW
jgi:hypothetical protein